MIATTESLSSSTSRLMFIPSTPGIFDGTEVNPDNVVLRGVRNVVRAGEFSVGSVVSESSVTVAASGAESVDWVASSFSRFRRNTIATLLPNSHPNQSSRSSIAAFGTWQIRDGNEYGTRYRLYDKLGDPISAFESHRSGWVVIDEVHLDFATERSIDGAWRVDHPDPMANRESTSRMNERREAIGAQSRNAGGERGTAHRAAKVTSCAA